MRRTQLVRNPQPMHPPVYGLPRLNERPLQIREMVALAVMVGHIVTQVLPTVVANVVQRPFD